MQDGQRQIIRAAILAESHIADLDIHACLFNYLSCHSIGNSPFQN